MAIRSFKEEEIEIFFTQGKVPRRCGWDNLAKVAKRKLDMLHYARELKDLLSPPSNFLESLAGNLKGFYSIRINDRWRVVFRWDKELYDLHIKDYH
jgi:proteic killer suppression protein